MSRKTTRRLAGSSMPHYRRLLLLRHGHAEPESEGLSDIERALDERGRNESAKSAQALLAGEYVPQLLLVSTARRTRETAAIIAQELGIGADRIHAEAVLYLASDTTLLQIIRDCPEGIRTLLVVGHNPGLSALARRFDAERTGIELRTGGACCIDLGEEPWAKLMPHAAPWTVLS